MFLTIVGAAVAFLVLFGLIVYGFVKFRYPRGRKEEKQATRF